MQEREQEHEQAKRPRRLSWAAKGVLALPLLVFLVAGAIGAGMTVVVYKAESSASVVRFEVVADEAVDRLNERLSQHTALLVSTQALFSANRGEVSQKEFASFAKGLELDSQFDGIQGIGFALTVPVGREFLAEQEIEKNYGVQLKVWPKTDQVLRTPIVLLEPSDERNKAALGFDMFSDLSRRQTMQMALKAQRMRASPPVKLVQEITARVQAGFLVYLPFRQSAVGTPGEPGFVPEISGFIYAPFRAGDLHMAALGEEPVLPVAVETRDTTDGTNEILYKSANFDQASKSSRFAVTRTVNFAGRTWTMQIRETPLFSSTTRHLGSTALGAISLMLAAALAAATYAQIKALETARELHEVSQKTIQEKDLMLQEMKHRIKNSLARVLAMARQTAASSDSLEEFSQSYSARLQAMANAQDVLTRSHWQKADLRELISQELEQVFGKSIAPEQIAGPPVELNEKATQALGLTFHELATNAMKYGALQSEGGGLDVSWSLVREEGKRRLELEWCEQSRAEVLAPQHKGFGTRLIDANIRGELGGAINRHYEGRTMRVVISIPV